MAEIKNIDNDAFAVDDFILPKIFIPVKIGEDRIKIISIYDATQIILEATPINQITVEGQSFNNARDLFNAIIKVIFGNFVVSESVYTIGLTAPIDGNTYATNQDIIISSVVSNGNENPDTTSINPVTSDFAYTVYDRPESGYNKRSAFSVLQINTDANDLNVICYSPLADAGYVNDAAISVYDENWVFVKTISPANTTGQQTIQVSLTGSGFRKYFLVEGGNTTMGKTDFKGTSITSIEAISGAVGVVPIPKSINRIVTIGDSISVGDGATINSRYAWSVRLRDALRASGWSITNDGWGAAYTLGMFETAALQQAGADRAVSEFAGASGRKVILWVLGTNDFGYVVGDPALVAQAAASVWDKAYAQDNGIEVKVVTPIYRNNQATANSGGWVLQDYRDALTAEASTRSFVTAYDGSSIITSADLTDNVHPNNTGHQKMADYIQTIL